MTSCAGDGGQAGDAANPPRLARLEEADRNFDRAAELLDCAEGLLWEIRGFFCRALSCLVGSGSYEKALGLLDAIAAGSFAKPQYPISEIVRTASRRHFAH